MRDFKKIGGEIVASPLNENFRKLRNDISIANTNLIFSNTNSIADNMEEMLSIPSPVVGQWCYVVSNGSIYRFANATDGWVKIGDFGQTFRQGFLNSGIAVFDGTVDNEGNPSSAVTLGINPETGEEALCIPKLLAYFKNAPGDEKYLKGMYELGDVCWDIPASLSPGGYSLTINKENEIGIIQGLPLTDDVNNIFVASAVVLKLPIDDSVYPAEEYDMGIWAKGVYTIPDIPYTADRGAFIFNGGEAAGMGLMVNAEGGVDRTSGIYYDEGIKYPCASIEDYPSSVSEISNYNLKMFEGVNTPELWYLIPDPVELFTFPYNTARTKILTNLYWNAATKTLDPVDNAHFTIQRHCVTPSGQSMVFFGDTLYNSLEDAVSHMNEVGELPDSFLLAETTRIAIQGDTEVLEDQVNCRIVQIGRLATAGTLRPEFSDGEFFIYKGGLETQPAKMRFALDRLTEAGFIDTTILAPQKPTIDRKYFFDTKAYIDKNNNATKIIGQTVARLFDGSPGYEIADHTDILDLRQRVSDVEREIWKTPTGTLKYAEGIRVRLEASEDDIAKNQDEIIQLKEDTDNLKQTKVDKTATINGYSFVDSTDPYNSKSIVLDTMDIQERIGVSDESNNLYFTDDRVSASPRVVEAYNHINTISANDSASTHTVVNPHNTSTDDVRILSGSQKIFVAPDQERRIRSDRLPENTISELATLDLEKIENIPTSIRDELGNVVPVGDVKEIIFDQDGVNLNFSGNTLIIECLGRADATKVMYRDRYANIERSNEEEYYGYVDNAVHSITADSLTSIVDAGPDKYYGTNSDGVMGTHPLPVYVTTADATDYADVDQVTFVPIDGSVQHKHLSTELAEQLDNNYHTVYNNGTLIGTDINTFRFGDNLIVTQAGNVATINAAAPGSSNVTNFTNLSDVDVQMSGNAGKLLTISEDELTVTVSPAPRLDQYMTKAVYAVGNTAKVKNAEEADHAAEATLANEAVLGRTLRIAGGGSASLNDGLAAAAGVLWSSSKTVAQATTIANNAVSTLGVKIYSGTAAPANNFGKEGDLYLLLE